MRLSTSRRFGGLQHGELAVDVDRRVESLTGEIHRAHVALDELTRQLAAQLARVAEGGRAEINAGDRDPAAGELRGIEARAAGHVEQTGAGGQPQPIPHHLHLAADLRQPAAGRAVALVQMLLQHPLAEGRVIPRQVAAVPPRHRG